MSITKRTVLILDHSPHARRRACHEYEEKAMASNEFPDNDEFDLEPCSMWSSFVHACLHYTRLAWDLSPVGQRTQVSVHVAPGSGQTSDSIVLNTWANQDQSLGSITSQLRELQLRDDDMESVNAESDDMDDSGGWIEHALKGAIAHALEPIPVYSTPLNTISTPSKMTINVIMLLADLKEETKMDDEDTEMGDEDDERAWIYGDLDLRKLLMDALYSLQECVRNSRVSAINVEFIRVSTQSTAPRPDILKEDISRVCSSSVYTITTKDETTVTSGLINHYLRQNRGVQLLRLHNLPLKRQDNDEDNSNNAPVELFYRSDHIRALAWKKADMNTGNRISAVLHDTPQNLREIAELEYGVECTELSNVIPTECTHLASISPSTFTASFFPFINGKVHLLKHPGPGDLASKALFDHDGQLFIHCLQSEPDPLAFSMQAAQHFDTNKKVNVSSSNYHLEEFVDAILYPNLIVPGADSFSQEGNIFTEIVPPALKSITCNHKESEGEDDYKSEEGASSRGVHMTLVHTTSKLDLETRWLVQWEGERTHPILPAHNTQIQRFKSAICKNSVDTAGVATINSVLDNLIADARPLALPGESTPSGQGMASQQQQRYRESAQAILADLWMIGQRFKSVSPSHAEAARLIATKVTPKGLDHQTVRLTLVPPSRRAALINAEAQGGSPMFDNGDMGSDGWSRNKGQRGGNNPGGIIGRGGNRGGRFDNRGGRGGAGVNNAAGRGRGGFRGSHNTNSPGGNNSNAAISDDMSFSGMDSSAGPNNDIMLSMTGKTQPVPYLITQPPTREELEESEQEYLAQLGEDGCLLKAYWGSRGAQGSAIASVLNSVTSLDAPSANASSSDIQQQQQHQPDPIVAVALAAQQKMKKLPTKRLRLQDFAGRTPSAENGGFSK